MVVSGLKINYCMDIVKTIAICKGLKQHKKETHFHFNNKSIYITNKSL